MKALGNNLSDQDHLSLAKLILDLNRLGDELNRVSPKHAKSLYGQLMPQLEKKLEEAKGALVKRMRQDDRKRGARSEKGYVHTVLPCILQTQFANLFRSGTVEVSFENSSLFLD